MGVQNFWQLIESTGRSVNMNKGLEGKVLAIDISIWLHQAAKGMRDRQNPHILLLLHRICKLLHFKIKPIFIFDGGVPELKRRTLRRQRREVAANKVKEANSKIRSNYLKMLAIQQLRGEPVEALPPLPVEDREKDLFELPDTHLRAQLADEYDHQVDEDGDDDDDDDDDVIENSELEPMKKYTQPRTTWSKKPAHSSSNHHYELPDMNQLDDQALSQLPMEMQHDILSEMKESLKRRQHQTSSMPQKSDDFSDYQVQKLLKQNSVSKKLFTLNKAMKRQKFDVPLESDARIYAGKLASDSNTQYILIKSDKTPANPVRASTTSTPSPSFGYRISSDFSADSMMERDPLNGLTQRKSVTTEEEPITVTDVREASPITEKPESVTIDTIEVLQKSPERQQGEENDEERRALELSIQRSLEDQGMSSVEPKHESPVIVESDTSDSDDSDFIDVPPLPKSSEPIILPDFIVEAIHRDLNTSSESIEQVHDDDSSHNNTAIEDITTFINENQDLTLPTEPGTQEPPVLQLESFDQLEAELIDDTAAQLHSARGNERLTATLTDTMHEDTQYLLRLFGIPYLVSPTEAEAQCAFLNLSQQCDGVITDDSDVWLFGASKVYRHFFRQNQLVEYYDSSVIEKQLGLDRETMIAIGMIVGSDYTKGIANAGVMTALEILQEFHGTCMERLENFRRWWKKAQSPGYSTKSKVMKRLKNLEVFEGFPNHAVYDAYIHPKVDADHSKFTWAMPQLELIREFIGSKLKWDRKRVDEMVLPVIKRMNTHEVQTRLDAFFAPRPFEGTSNQVRRNTRLKSSLDLLKQRAQEAKDGTNTSSFDLLDDQDDEEPNETEGSNTLAPATTISKKRKRSTKTTKLMDDVLSVVEKTKLPGKQRTKRKPTKAIAAALSEDDSF